MWCKVLILTVVSVTAQKGDPANFRDRYVPRSGFDFGSNFGRKGFEFDDGHGFDRPEFRDHRSFSRDFKHRQFFHSSNGDDTGYGSGSRDFEASFKGHESGHKYGSFDSQSEFHRRGSENHHQFSSGDGNRFRHSGNDDRRHGVETLEPFESHNRRGSGGFNRDSGRDFSNFGSSYGGRNFQRSVNAGSADNSFNQNTDASRKDEIPNFGSIELKSDSSNRNFDAEHKELSNKHKEEFELITNDNKRKFDDQSTANTFQDPKNISSNLDDKNITVKSESVRQHLKIYVNSNNVSQSHYNLNNVTEIPETVTITQRPVTTGILRINARKNQRNNTKTTTDNEVLSEIQPRTDGKGENETEDDRWIWDSGENKTTTKKPDGVDLDDRAAFDGGKCPTGKVKVGNTCVDVD